MTAASEQQPPAPREHDERRRAALDLLEGGTHTWLATGSDGHGAHLIPIAYVWDGNRLTMATFRRSRTAANARANPRARAAVGHALDLVMIDGDLAVIEPTAMDQDTATAYAEVSFDPRAMPGLVYLRLTPARMQVWSGFHEFHGRTVMTDGTWLDEPLDNGSETRNLPAWMTPG